MTETQPSPRYIVDIVKHRAWYLGISLILLLPGLWFFVQNIITSPTHSPVKLGLDFVGGTLIEYGTQKPLATKQIPEVAGLLEKAGLPGAIVQIQLPAVKAGAKPAYQSVVSIRTESLNNTQLQTVQSQLQQHFGKLTLLQRSSVGPTLAGELLKNGVLALVFAYLLIVGYLTLRFQLDYAICAMVALLHDTLFVFTTWALLGSLFGFEVDSLFITGLLTVVGFSVHDTIVVFDRLRENSRLFYSKKLPFGQIANISINQTLARSINTSVAALLPLTALLFFGGESTHNLVLTMWMGILVGTYSSICVASLMLTWWRERPQSGAVLA